MTDRRQATPAAAIVAAVLVVASALRCVERDELHCENAVAQLERCCAGFPAGAITCDHAEGCGSGLDIAEEDADCIVAMSCGAVQQAGICERALHPIPGADLCP